MALSRVAARAVESGPDGENLAPGAWQRLEALPDPRSPPRCPANCSLPRVPVCVRLVTDSAVRDASRQGPAGSRRKAVITTGGAGGDDPVNRGSACAGAGEGGEAGGGGRGIGGGPGFPLPVAGDPPGPAISPRGQASGYGDDGGGRARGGVDAGEAVPGEQRGRHGGGAGRVRAVTSSTRPANR